MYCSIVVALITLLNQGKLIHVTIFFIDTEEVVKKKRFGETSSDVTIAVQSGAVLGCARPWASVDLIYTSASLGGYIANIHNHRLHHKVK
jgi:hypothetical protein